MAIPKKVRPLHYMTGLYIHIPFCRQACHYCNFHFSTQLKHINPLVDAICAEIDQQNTSANPLPIHTIYFGGGSPSLLSPQQLHRIFEAIHRNFNTQNCVEITLEANPEDINPTNLQHWKALGINRLSLGIQSLNNEELQWMNRAHTAEQSLQAVELCTTAGFHNLSIDLIYGSEKKSLDQWKSELQWALACGANHLSCYALTIEDKTAFGQWARDKKLIPPADEHAEAQFHYLSQWAAENHWEHYEISNLCKPQHRAIHNSNYWSGHPYIGIGPSAHSFDGQTRRWNVSSNHKYMHCIQNNLPVFEEEILTKSNKINEYLLTQLRTTDGAEIQQLEKLWPGFIEEKQSTIQSLQTKHQLQVTQTNLLIPSTARFLADAITVELMMD